MGALSDHEKEIMLNSGFLRKEVNTFDKAETSTGEIQAVAFNSITWQHMLNSRREWVKMCHNLGYENKAIRGFIVHHYDTSKERSPWDFLKVEYQPTDRSLTDTEFADKLGIRSAIYRNLISPTKANYGSSMASEFRPIREETPMQKATAKPAYKPLMPVKKHPKTEPVIKKPKRKFP